MKTIGMHYEDHLINYYNRLQLQVSNVLLQHNSMDGCVSVLFLQIEDTYISKACLHIGIIYSLVVYTTVGTGVVSENETVRLK